MKQRVGIIGSGFIGKGLVNALHLFNDIEVTKVLTRSRVDTRGDYRYPDLLTHSVDEVIEHSDVIVECTGDVLFGTDMIAKVMEAGIPVVTMNTELQVTTGSYFAKRGYITEAEGDQPGCLAALRENVLQMGFEPMVFGNIKGFLNPNPSPKDMLYWSNRNKISLEMVTSFTDGTKVEFEQTLVANGLNTKFLPSGIMGISAEDLQEGANALALEADQLGYPISDYVLSSKAPAGVFITAKHLDMQGQRNALQYMKLGDGPYYTIIQPFHLCHLEVVKTIRRVFEKKEVLLNNSCFPSYSMGSIAKKKLNIGTVINRGIGSFEVRGKALKIEDEPNHIPIGLLDSVRIIKPVEEGEILTFSHVEIDDSLAYRAWMEIKEQSILLQEI
ncbi:NAD(P)-dependent oxidoreductase [Pradoshia sp. D12]|nr:NAD(P)-dependent oxidoreductase [Pradoshia sp. D12]TPF73744.1 NAD(P)-dependent oxidoreductase [Bacillus sp. D12]